MSDTTKYIDQMTFEDGVYHLKDTEARKTIEAIEKKIVYAEDGKGLSTNDFSDYYKQTLESSAKTIASHASDNNNPHNVTTKQIGLENLTNDKQVKGLSSGTTAGNVVTWGADGYSVKDSGYTIKKSVPEDAEFTDTVYTHPSIATNSGTSSETIGFGKSFKAIGSITVNNEGHVTDLDTKTFTMPSETTLTKEESGTGNVVNDISVDGHKVTVTKENINYAGASTPGGALTSGVSWEVDTADADRNIWFSDTKSTDTVGIPAHDNELKYNPSSNTLKVSNVCIGDGCTVNYNKEGKCLDFTFEK